MIDVQVLQIKLQAHHILCRLQGVDVEHLISLWQLVKLGLPVLGIKRRASSALSTSARFTLLAAQIIGKSSTGVLVVANVEGQLNILIKI